MFGFIDFVDMGGRIGHLNDTKLTFQALAFVRKYLMCSDEGLTLATPEMKVDKDK